MIVPMKKVLLVALREDKDALAPVSYTHLDVYKRQVVHQIQYDTESQTMGFFDEIPKVSVRSIPVSYTHLPSLYSLCR